MTTRNIRTTDIELWTALGATQIRPNFDRPGYSIATFESPRHALNATMTMLCEEFEGRQKEIA